MRPDFKEGHGRPAAGRRRFARSAASATSPLPALASETEADAERFIAEVERKMDALSAEVGRKMDALSAEMDALFAEVGRLEGHQDSTSPQPNKPPASPPPAVAVSPVAPPATSPVLPLASEAAADTDRPVAAVELERDAAAAEVDRLQSHRDSISPEPATPLASPPPAVAVSPAPPLASLPVSPPATSPVLPPASEAAADADRPVAAVERESDAMAAEVGRLEGVTRTRPLPKRKPTPPGVVAAGHPPLRRSRRSHLCPLRRPQLSPVPAACPRKRPADTDLPRRGRLSSKGTQQPPEVDRLQSHRDLTSPEPADPPGVAAAGRRLFAARSAARIFARFAARNFARPCRPPRKRPPTPIAASRRLSAKWTRCAAEVGFRLEGHQDSRPLLSRTNPRRRSPPAVAVSPVAQSAHIRPSRRSRRAAHLRRSCRFASEAAADADIAAIAAVEQQNGQTMAAEVGQARRSPGSRPLPAAEQTPGVADRLNSCVAQGIDCLFICGRCGLIRPGRRRGRSSLCCIASRRKISADLPVNWAAGRATHQRRRRIPVMWCRRRTVSPDIQQREDARPAPPVVHAGVADLHFR